LEGNGRAAIPDTPQVLITAHGISTHRRTRLKAAGKILIDTTCPLVKKAHAAAMRLRDEGYHVLVIGRPDHVEVQGITEDLVHFDVLPDVTHVQAYPYDRLGIMCQTTTPSESAAQIHAAVRQKNPRATIRFIDTICQPTKDRQNALENLLDQVHTVVVVGGANSHNTRRLAQRCRARGAIAYHVQNADDLNPQWFYGVATVGLTAGTSTLPETIETVYQALRKMETTSDQTAREYNMGYRSAGRNSIECAS
ncbi:MAG: hypothetical protein ACP5VQ_07150, partial [Phycisphaerae bacterium]